MISRDSLTKSPWQLTNAIKGKPLNLSNNDEIFDAIIIGAGITGLTTGLLLQRSGKKCLIVENGTIGFGTTGGTSAHLNTFFDATYPEIESDFGENNAKLVAEAGKEAIKLIQALAKELNIECDLEEKNGFLFAQDEEQVKELQKILSASKRAGVTVKEVEKIELPISFQTAIEFKNQGQFHPIKYINGLAVAFKELGGSICEKTFVSDVEEINNIYSVVSEEKVFTGLNVIYATHAVPGINAFSFKCAPYRSYVIGIKLKDNNYPKDLAYDMMEPYHYFRSHVIEGQKYLLVGGEDHKTGQGDPEKAFKALNDYVNQYFEVEEVTFRWSSQYYVPSDGLPYIGKMPGEEKCYVATGFNGNGMIFGTLAGLMISDEILGLENKYKELFSPSRVKPIARFSDFVQENANVAWHFIADRFRTEAIDSLKEIPNDSGKIATFEGEKLAIYKDKKGKVTLLNPVCTHAGCIVGFNPIEKSWDCPCHGGRFDLEGNLLCGPPKKNLARHTE